MAMRPTQVLRWAWDAIAGAIVQPPSANAEAGFTTAQRPPAQWFNALFNNVFSWVDFLRGPHVEHWTRVAWGTSPGSYDATSPVLLAVDAYTTDAVGAAYRYAIAGWETTGPTSTLHVSQRGNTWTRRTNTPGALGKPTALALSRGGASDLWLMADDASQIFYTAVDAGGAGGAIGSAGGSWSTATVPGGMGDVVAIACADDGSAVAITGALGAYTTDGATWTNITEGSARTGNATDIVWDGVKFVYVCVDGKVYSCATAGGTFAHSATLPASGAWRLAAGESGCVLAHQYVSSAVEDFHYSDNSASSFAAVSPVSIEQADGTIPSVLRITKIAYNDGTWLATSTYAPFLWVSNDAETWLPLRMPVSGTDLALYNIAWDGGAWIVAGNGWVLQCPRGADPSGAALVASTTPATLSDAASLRGVTIATDAPADNDVLTYDLAQDRWEPRAPAAASLNVLSSPTVSTANATQTTCGTLAVATDTTVLLDVLVMAARDDGSTSVAWQLLVTATNVAGTLTVRGSVVVTGPTDAATTWGVTVDVSGTSLRVRVTGAAATAIDWSASASRVVI